MGRRYAVALAVVAMMAVARGLLPGGPGAQAAHYDNGFDLVSFCYDCHTLNWQTADDNTSFINASARTLPTMRLRNGGVTPATFGCTFCHNDPTRTSYMKSVSSAFDSRPSQHPVDRAFSRDVYTNVTLGANTYTSLFLSNWDNSYATPANEIGCMACHAYTAVNDGKGYSNHPLPSSPSRQPAANPSMLKGVTAMDNGFAPNSFCLSNCHGRNAPGPAAWKMGHLGWGAWDNTTGGMADNTLKEPSGVALKTAKCADCHETHSSQMKWNLMGEGRQSRLNVDPNNCVNICHNNATFLSAGHGKPGVNLMCINCHDASVSHRDQSNPRRLAGSYAQNPATLTENLAANGRDDNFNGLVDEAAEQSHGYNEDAYCSTTCHSDKHAHKGSIQFNNPPPSGTSGLTVSCLNCHDPHGNGVGANIRMIRRSVMGGTLNVIFQTTTAPYDYYRADNNSICNNVNCHGRPLGNINTPGTILGDTPVHREANVQPGNDCRSCHNHNSILGGASFEPVCNTCHDYPGQPHLSGTHVLSPVHDKHVAPDNASGYGLSCGTCHYLYTHNQSKVTNAGQWAFLFQSTNVNIKFAPFWNPKNGNGPTYGGAAADNTLPDNVYAPGLGEPGFGQCVGLYCHGDASTQGTGWPTGTNTKPSWGDPTSGACGTCHRATASNPPQTFAHPKHASDNTSAGYGISCRICHYLTTSDGVTIASRTEHLSRQSRVSFDVGNPLVASGAYGGTQTPGTSVGDSGSDGGARCTNIYCHSTGNRLSPPFDNGAVAAVVWNQAGPLACTACHGQAGQAGIRIGMPAYLNNAPKRNSHAPHLDDKFGCQVCHWNTTRDGATVPPSLRANHVNGIYDAVSDNVARHAFVYDNVAWTCSNAACHGGAATGPNVPVWGMTAGVPIGCDVCHMNSTGAAATYDLDRYVYDNGMAKVRADHWNDPTVGSGHGRQAAFPSGNPGAGARFPTCTTKCHSSSVSHDNAVNPFRLRTFAGVVNFSDTNADPGSQQADNRVCLDCHSATGADNVSATVRVEQNHYGTWQQNKHTASTMGGTFCIDCHDPHGDANHYMVHDNVAKTSDGVYGVPTAVAPTTFSKVNLDGAGGLDNVYDWGDYVKSSAPYTGICQTCHAASGGAAFFNTGASGFTPTHKKYGNPPARCAECHLHDYDFSPSCNYCHGDPNDTTGAPPDSPRSGARIWSASVDRIGNRATQGLHKVYAADNALQSDHDALLCDVCHTSTPGLGSTHNNAANLNATMTSLTSRRWTDNTTPTSWTPRTDGSTSGVIDDSCNNVDCHSPYGGYQATQPSGTPFPYERYWENYNLWDCHTCHGYKDAADNTNNPGAFSRRVSTGSHDRHIRTVANGGANLDCSNCHETGNATKYNPASQPGTHKGGYVDWTFAGAPNPFSVPAASRTYSGSPVGGVAPYSPTDNNIARGHRGWGSCANLYCHSIGQTASGGTLAVDNVLQYRPPRWDNGFGGRCGDCHRGDGGPDNAASIMASGSHAQHLAAPYGFSCATCHNGYGRNMPAHVDGQINLAFGTIRNGTTFNATYSQGNAHAAGNGFGGCTATYCHGTGTPALSGGANQAGTPVVPVWDNAASGNCGSCHGGPSGSTLYPGKAFDYPTSGSHARHMLDLRGPRMTQCADCHTASTLSTHVDGKVDLRTAWNDNTPSTRGATRICDPCHAGGVATAKANWDTVAAIDCLLCHMTGSLANARTDNTGITAPNVGGDNVAYGANRGGHGRQGANYPSGNFPANQPCGQCHDAGSLHINNVNDNGYAGNRLLDNVSGRTGLNSVPGLCDACHNNPASPVSDQFLRRVNTHGNTSAAFKAKSTHDNNAEDFAYNCDACHEPHGMTLNGRTGTSANIFMIKPSLELRNIATGSVPPDNATLVTGIVLEARTGSFSFDDGVSVNTTRVCVACHVNASRPGGGTALRNAAGDGTHAGLAVYNQNEQGKDCSLCHPHNMDDNVLTLDGFMPQPCNGCHSYPDMDNAATGLGQMSRGHWDHVGRPNAGGTAASRAYPCRMCHLNYNHNQSGVANETEWASKFVASNVNVNFDNSWNPSNANGPRYNGVATPTGGNGGTGVCAGLYCHGNNAVSNVGWAGSAPTPRWDNASYGCGSCHRADGGFALGNHGAHLGAAFGPGIAAFSGAGNCNEAQGCHTRYLLTPTSTHVDNAVEFRTTSADNTAVGLGATQICHNCHSATAASPLDNGAANAVAGYQLAKNNWNDNGYKLPCVTCHNDGTQGTQNLDGTGDKAANVAALYFANGHGATALDCTATATDNGAKDQVMPVRCGTCHDELGPHIGTGKDLTNPWRLDNALTKYAQTGGLDNYCLGQCHAAASNAAHHAWIENGIGSAAKNDNVNTHPTSTAVVSQSPIDKSRWFLVPSDMALPLAGTVASPLTGDLTNKPAPARTGTEYGRLLVCVTCHDPHGVGTALTPTRTFSGANDNVYGMLRFRHRSPPSPATLCTKCHQ